MSIHELEHLSLLRHKLLVSPILCFSIGIEVASECTYILLMVKAYLLNIKGDGVKVLNKALK